MRAMVLTDGDLDLRNILDGAWCSLSLDDKRILANADNLVKAVALKTAVAVAQTLRSEDIEHRPICARKAERDVLEMAAKELKMLVMRTADMPHAMDGQIPLAMESGNGLIGIEVKSGACSISTDEVNKFREDLVMSSFAVGIFVSLRAPIAKFPKGIHVQQELSLVGSIPCIFISPLANEHVMTNLTRSAMALACMLARRNSLKTIKSHPSTHETMTAEHRKDLEQLGLLIHEEIAALSITRKRLRDEEEAFHRRVSRASDALMATQQRLSQSIVH